MTRRRSEVGKLMARVALWGTASGAFAYAMLPPNGLRLAGLFATLATASLAVWVARIVGSIASNLWAEWRYRRRWPSE